MQNVWSQKNHDFTIQSAGKLTVRKVQSHNVWLTKTLTKEQKGDWPSHLPALTFAYNATPHSSTSYQPYELMFGRKAPALCDNWLGLRQYNDDKSISKVVWVDKQFEKIVQANKRVLKSIQARHR